MTNDVDRQGGEEAPVASMARPESGASALRLRGHDDGLIEILPPSGDAVFAGGWYWLDLRLDVADQRVHSPFVFCDMGGGYQESTRSSLQALVGSHGLSGVIRLDDRTNAVALDLGLPADCVEADSLTLMKIGKGLAAKRLGQSVLRRARSRRWFVAGLVRSFAGGGVRGVGDWLYREYIFEEIPLHLNYWRWCTRFARLSEDDLEVLARRAESIPGSPLISIILPVYNTEPKWLCRCIDSVIGQAYERWELCIADDASTNEETRATLRSYAEHDSRIKLRFRESNGHISVASNSALEMATGDWVALLDHDDELPPYALYAVAKAIADHPDAGLLYSDEDKVSALGERFDPYFKSEWNPDLFYGHNMVSHLGVYRADLMRRVGGFREGYEGSQDYDLALRCIEQLQPQQIVHIPHVLYHWRAIPGSTALAVGEKSYAAIAAERALADHFERTGQRGVRVEAVEGGNRIHYPLPEDGEPRVSLIIPTRDRVDLLRVCVGSILERTDYSNYEIVIVDNQSVEPATHEYFAELAGNPRVRIFPFDEPFNYSRLNNAAVATSDAEVIGLINNDIEVIGGGWMREMVSHAIRPEIGCVGAMLYYPDDTIQHAGVILGAGGVANHAYLHFPRGYVGYVGRARVAQNLSAVTAACLLVRRSVYEQVGGLDARLRIAFNDVDFCLRVREQGYRNLWTPHAELYHHESASRGIEDTPEKRARFAQEVGFMLEHWGDQLANDPAYSPNLSLTADTFNLAVPPRKPLWASLGLGATAGSTE